MNESDKPGQGPSSDNGGIQPWIDPELEARVVAAVVGEASEFELAELDRLLQEKPELAVFKRRIEAVHGLVGESFGEASTSTDEEWRMAPERREKLLATIGLQQAAKDLVDEEPTVSDASEAKTVRVQWRKWLGGLSVAAAVVVMFAVLSVSRIKDARSFMMATAAHDAVREAEPTKSGAGIDTWNFQEANQPAAPAAGVPIQLAASDNLGLIDNSLSYRESLNQLSDATSLGVTEALIAQPERPSLRLRRSEPMSEPMSEAKSPELPAVVTGPVPASPQAEPASGPAKGPDAYAASTFEVPDQQQPKELGFDWSREQKPNADAEGPGVAQTRGGDPLSDAWQQQEIMPAFEVAQNDKSSDGVQPFFESNGGAKSESYAFAGAAPSAVPAEEETLGNGYFQSSEPAYASVEVEARSGREVKMKVVKGFINPSEDGLGVAAMNDTSDSMDFQTLPFEDIKRSSGIGGVLAGDAGLGAGLAGGGGDAAGYGIDLAAAPEVVEFNGFVDYGRSIGTNGRKSGNFENSPAPTQAGGAVVWDTPMVADAQIDDDVVLQPQSSEYQRNPGHPADRFRSSVAPPGDGNGSGAGESDAKLNELWASAPGGLGGAGTNPKPDAQNWFGDASGARSLGRGSTAVPSLPQLSAVTGGTTSLATGLLSGDEPIDENGIVSLGDADGDSAASETETDNKRSLVEADSGVGGVPADGKEGFFAKQQGVNREQSDFFAKGLSVSDSESAEEMNRNLAREGRQLATAIETKRENEPRALAQKPISEERRFALAVEAADLAKDARANENWGMAQEQLGQALMRLPEDSSNPAVRDLREKFVSEYTELTRKKFNAELAAKTGQLQAMRQQMISAASDPANLSSDENAEKLEAEVAQFDEKLDLLNALRGDALVEKVVELSGDSNPLVKEDSDLYKRFEIQTGKQLQRIDEVTEVRDRLAAYAGDYLEDTKVKLQVAKAKLTALKKRDNPDATAEEPPAFAPVTTTEELASENAFSTFSLNVSDVAFKLAQSALMKGEWPEAEKMRVEEFVNALDYGDPAPGIGEKVACRTEQCAHPFMQQRNLLRIAMRTAAVGRGGGQPLRLTILLDHSGSMQREDREASVRRAMEVLAGQLQPSDQVSLLGFARTPRLLADRISGSEGGKLIAAVDAAPSEGGTNLEEALRLAAEVAQRQFDDGAVNRIVLMTDGAANLGNADPQDLAARVVELRQKGIAFDACGVGAKGLNDEVLEALTRKGDGRYYFLDAPEQADSGFVSQLAGALRPAAKNVKVQVVFNPERVGAYRLIGYEKHRLKKEDFRNDAVDAAEMAAEETGVAVYQIEPKADGYGDVGEVRVRFQDVASGRMIEHNWIIPYEEHVSTMEDATPSIQLAGTAAMLGEYLRGGPEASNVDLDVLSSLAPNLRSAFGDNVRVNQLIGMIRDAQMVK